jgi:multiple antibiotic resistance protein
MKDLGYAFTIFLLTLGPIKIVAPFFLATHRMDRRTILLIALRSTVVATLIAVFIALSVVSTMANLHVSIEAVAIGGGILLLIASIRTVSGFTPIETPSVGAIVDEALTNGGARPTAPAVKIPWLGTPVLSPIAIPTIITPIGVVSILVFADASIGDKAYEFQLTGVLLSIMAMNFVAMAAAGHITRLLHVPILQILGWVLSSVQAGLAVQLIISALRRLNIIP